MEETIMQPTDEEIRLAAERPKAYLTYAELRRRGWTRDEILAMPPSLTVDMFEGAHCTVA
jgi:hypothetical protein